MSSSSAASASNAVPPPQDVNSLLTHVQTIESDRARLLKELEMAKEKMSKLSEGKRVEMKQALDNVIMKMIKDSVEDEKIREEFESGMKRLVEETADNSGVWQVVACASANYGKKLEELERLRGEVDGYRARGGEFQSDESRKRKADDPPSRAGAGDIWADFENSMKGKGIWTPPL